MNRRLKNRKNRKNIKFNFFKIKLRLQRLWDLLKRKNFSRLVLIIILIVSLSTIGIYFAEPNVSLLDSLWWTIVTLTTVGYGDITPVTKIGRLIAVIDMIIGVGVLAIFSATLASILVDEKIREDLGMNSYDFENYLIIFE